MKLHISLQGGAAVGFLHEKPRACVRAEGNGKCIWVVSRLD
jgi:hypothetical protein